MIKFLVLLEGYGQGCDYTIDCNKKWIWIEAESREQAIKKVVEDWYGVAYHVRDYESHSIKDIQMIPVSEVIDLGSYCLQEQDRKNKIELDKATKEREQKERAEYERLQKKFGGK
jgi:hypothetical protein